MSCLFNKEEDKNTAYFKREVNGNESIDEKNKASIIVNNEYTNAFSKRHGQANTKGI